MGSPSAPVGPVGALAMGAPMPSLLVTLVLLGRLLGAWASHSVCPQRCSGPRALLPGFAPCLSSELVNAHLNLSSNVSEDALVWDENHFHMPASKRECYLGTYLADAGSCPLRLPTKADMLNCHRAEMARSNKRTRFILLGASSEFTTVKTLIDVLDEGTNTGAGPSGVSSGSSRTWLGWGRTASAASGTLDVIFDSNMTLRYAREGGALLADGMWFPRGPDVKAIQDAPDFGPGSVRITWFGTRYGVDLDNSVRLALGLSAKPTPVYTEADLAHPRRYINCHLNNYSASGDLPPEGTAHYNWTSEESTIIDVHLSMRDLSEYPGRSDQRRYGAFYTPDIDLAYMRWWLMNTTTPQMRSYAPLRSVVWGDVYPADVSHSNPRRFDFTPQASFMMDVVAEIQAAPSNDSAMMPWRTRNEQPYIDFHQHHGLGNEFDRLHGYIQRYGRHALKPWLVWYVAQWMAAICSSEGDYISECGTLAWFRHGCYEIGAGWRDNVRALCTWGSTDLGLQLGPHPGESSASWSDETNSSDDVLSSDVVADLVAGMLNYTAGLGADEDWVEQICETCEYEVNRRRRAAMQAGNGSGTGGRCTCGGFGPVDGAGVNGSNFTNASTTDDRCHLHRVHSIQWLPFTKLCESPHIPEHIWWYGVLLLVVVLCFGTPRRKPSKGTNEGTSRRIDTSSLTGLRGFAAMHVALGHHTSKVPEFGFIYGNTAMPFFYLLSGFIMVIAYAAKPVACPSLQDICSCGRVKIDTKYAHQAQRGGEDSKSAEDIVPASQPEVEQETKSQTDDKPAIAEKPHPRVFEVRRFWRNRFARLFPVYFATNLLTLPLTYNRPRLLTIEGQNSVRALVFGSVGLTSWSEFTLSFGRLLPGPPLSGPKSFLFPPNNVTWTISTMMSFYLVFPFVAPWMQDRRRSTYQLWIVGLYVLQLATWVLYASLLGDGFEGGYWHARAAPLSRIPVFVMGCAGGFLRLQEGNDGSSGTTTDVAFGAYLIVILSAGLVSSGFGYDLNLTAALEALCPPMQLAVILDLTRDAGQSRTAQFCKTRLMTTLGDISMSFYMLHYSIMMYVALLHDWDPLPWYAVPYSLSMSLILGYGATQYYEKPADKYLRMPRQQSP